MAVQNAIGLTVTGVVVHDGSGAFTGRTITASDTKVVVTNGNGTAGNPTIGVDGGLILDGEVAGNGIVTRTAAETYTNRTLTGTANQVVIANGDGVSGNPTFSTPQDIATNSNVTFGNITGNTLQAKTKVETDGDNDADIGDSSNAFKDIYMQGNLYFDNDNSRTQKQYCWVPLSKGTASASASLEFTLTAGWDFFMFVYDKIIPATDAATFLMKMSDDGGSTYEASNGRAALITSNAGGLRAFNATNATSHALADDIGNDDALHGVSGEMRLYNPNDATNYCRFISNAFFIDENATNEFTYQTGGGQVRVSGNINYIQFSMSAGNIASGTITMYGKNNI